jgi:hypothetical protein
MNVSYAIDSRELAKNRNMKVRKDPNVEEALSQWFCVVSE